MKEVTVKELKEMMDNGVDFHLIDVREPYEHEMANIGGELIPMATVAEQADKISKTGNVIIYCRSGNRSAAVIRLLENSYGFTNLSNLKGGVIAWSDEIDNTFPKY